MLILQNIHCHIQGVPVLQDVDWQVAAGQHSLLLGASGSGKTTLLHLMAGLLTPSKGDITYQQQPINSQPWLGQRVSLVFQTLHLVGALHVLDNLRLAALLAQKQADDAHIHSLLERLGLAHKAKHYPHQLSVGQAQRVAIARALVNRPDFILADEPTSALDDANAQATIELLLEQASQYGATLIVATHDQRIKSHFSHGLRL